MTQETSERYPVLVNGIPCEVGCWVEGRWGQYGPDHLAARASEVGWEPDAWYDDPRAIRNIIETIESWGYPRDGSDIRSEGVNIVASLWELHSESASHIEDWLNEHTSTEGFSWGFFDGEFYLWPEATWEEEYV